MPARVRRHGTRPLAAAALLIAALAPEASRARQAPPAPPIGRARATPGTPPPRRPGSDPFAAPTQAPAATPADEPADLAQAPARDLTTRYLLAERHTPPARGQAPAAGPGRGPYQVAYRESETLSEENAQGAPARHSAVRQARFSERPVETGPADDRMVTALVRRYEAARVQTDDRDPPAGPPPVADLTVWVESAPGTMPRVLVLDEGRSLRESDFLFITRRTPYTPDLAYLLPEFPVRLYDTWPVDRRGLNALLAGGVGQSDIKARLAEVRPAAADEVGPGVAGAQVALIDLSGTAQTGRGEARLNARLEFTFVPGPAEPDAGPDAALDARGGVSKVRLAQVTTLPRQGADGPLGQSIRRELVLQRRWPGDGPPLAAPASAPAATPENSWVTYVDPDDRFHLRHPQEYLPDTRFGADTLALTANRPEGADLVILTFFDGDQPRIDRVFQEAFERKRQAGFRVQPTAPQTLPTDQWPGAEVHRVEAALTPDAAAPPANPAARLPQRLHFDGYLLLFTRNAALTAEAITAQARAAAFRDEVESILQTFRLGAPDQARP